MKDIAKHKVGDKLHLTPAQQERLNAAVKLLSGASRAAKLFTEMIAENEEKAHKVARAIMTEHGYPHNQAYVLSLIGQWGANAAADIRLDDSSEDGWHGNGKLGAALRESPPKAMAVAMAALTSLQEITEAILSGDDKAATEAAHRGMKLLAAASGVDLEALFREA